MHAKLGEVRFTVVGLLVALSLAVKERGGGDERREREHYVR